MDEILFNGRVYQRRNGRTWTYNNEVVPETLQRTLNKAWANLQDWNSWTNSRLIAEAKQCKESGDMATAIQYLETVRSRNPEGPDIRGMLAILSSCYRDERIRQPDKCIDLYCFYQQYGNRFLTPAFLTSVGAAYLDKGDLYTARKLADHAYAMNRGTPDRSLTALYQRLRAAGM